MLVSTEISEEPNIFVKIPLFVENEIADGIRTLGIENNRREWKFIESKYVDFNHENLRCYKAVFPVASGNGRFGEIIGTPIVEIPNEAYTRSFIGIGAFENRCEAESVVKYIKTKFARALLSVLKVTQMANKDVWQFVPNQNFTPASDIDWSKSISEIDEQLYSKYHLSAEEIEFVESHVQEMK